MAKKLTKAQAAFLVTTLVEKFSEAQEKAVRAIMLEKSKKYSKEFNEFKKKVWKNPRKYLVLFNDSDNYSIESMPLKAVIRLSHDSLKELDDMFERHFPNGLSNTRKREHIHLPLHIVGNGEIVRYFYPDLALQKLKDQIKAIELAYVGGDTEFNSMLAAIESLVKGYKFAPPDNPVDPE